MSLRSFYVVDGAPVGPISTEELERMGRSGAFAAETLVWIEGTADWQPFSKWSAEIAPPAAPAPEPRAPSVPEALPVAEPITSPAPAQAIEVEQSAQPLQVEQPEPVKAETPKVAPAKAVEVAQSAQPLRVEQAEPAKAEAPMAGRLFWALSWLSLIALALFLATAAVYLMGSPELSLAGMLADQRYQALRILFGLSVLSGLGALSGFRRYRNWQVIAPASVALVANGLLLLLAIPNNVTPAFLRSRSNGRGLVVRSGPMSPVKISEGATRISHPTLGFAFDVPAGFEELPLTKSSAKLWKLFGKPAMPNELAEVFGIQLLGTKLQRHLDVREIATDGNVNLGRLSWRGVEIDAVRIAEAKDGKSYVTYNVQVPLKGEAIQLMLGAPREREAELKARIEALLASLDGQSDW